MTNWPCQRLTIGACGRSTAGPLGKGPAAISEMGLSGRATLNFSVGNVVGRATLSVGKATSGATRSPAGISGASPATIGAAGSGGGATRFSFPSPTGRIGAEWGRSGVRTGDGGVFSAVGRSSGAGMATGGRPGKGGPVRGRSAAAIGVFPALTGSGGRLVGGAGGRSGSLCSATAKAAACGICKGSGAGDRAGRAASGFATLGGMAGGSTGPDGNAVAVGSETGIGKGVMATGGSGRSTDVIRFVSFSPGPGDCASRPDRYATPVSSRSPGAAAGAKTSTGLCGAGAVKDQIAGSQLPRTSGRFSCGGTASGAGSAIAAGSPTAVRKASANPLASPSSTAPAGGPTSPPGNAAIMTTVCIFPRLLPPMPSYRREKLPILYPHRGSFRKIRSIWRTRWTSRRPRRRQPRPPGVS